MNAQITGIFTTLRVFKKYLFNYYVCGYFAEICMCTMCVLGVQRDKKKALDSLKVKLETVVVVSSYMGPGNQV